MANTFIPFDATDGNTHYINPDWVVKFFEVKGPIVQTNIFLGITKGEKNSFHYFTVKLSAAQVIEKLNGTK